MSTQTPKYVAKLSSLIAAGKVGKPGTVQHLVVLHDDWCAFHRGGVCNCEPDIRVAQAKREATQ
jgi:uncharacterized protein YfaT (DUF1175 family)